MNLYVDLGCYDGDTVEEFRNWRRIAFPDKEEWDIDAFDPNPAFKPEWDKKVDDRTMFTQAAAWTEDGFAQFAIDESQPLGSTLMESKIKVWDSGKKIEVTTFDFSKYVKTMRDIYDFIVVKMDIEGAEFPLLEKMVREGTVAMCDWLMIEFHPNKVRAYTTEDKNRLLEVLRAQNKNVLEWH